MEEVIVMLSLILLNFFISLTQCCYPGIQSIGVVSPLGDIVAEVGDDIVINCTLKDDYKGPATSSDIRWRRNSTEVQPNFITVIDNQTAQLQLFNATMEDSGYYSCYIDIGNQSTVCNNDVRIGHPPSSAINITCLSRNWENLTCTWSPPYNPVRTTWSFFYVLSKYRLDCPEYLNDGTGCFLSDQTDPPYRPAAKTYYFFLEGSNPLGTKRTSYQFAHYEAVLPNPPLNLKALQVNSHKIQLIWSDPFGMHLFPPKLFYRLYYYSEWDKNWKVEEVGLNITSYIVTNLIPNTNYTFKLQCRSGASEKSPWSDPSYIWKKTPVDIPGSPPNVTPAGFEQKTKSLQKRDIMLNWQAIPKILENGNNVSYVIETLEDGILRAVTIKAQSLTSALIENLELEKEYVFRLRTKNEKGISVNISSLVIHKASRIPPLPRRLNVVAFEDGIYEFTWLLEKSVDISKIDNFTLIWCKAQNSLHNHHCYNSSIFWEIIPNNVTSINMSMLNGVNYQFALAVNIGDVSSGMKWASCIIPYNRAVSKLKSVSVIQNFEHKLKLSWRIDCNDRNGIMTGFNIYYCIFDADNDKCKGNETFREFESNPYAQEFLLVNLRPYTTYKITVSAMTKAGESGLSDPVINRTKEAAPEDSPIMSLSSITNSSIIVSVKNPEISNGIIRDFRFYVNNKRWDSVRSEGRQKFALTDLNSYTNYSVQVVVCTLGELCSPPSPALVVMTEIGIPNPPTITEVKLFNTTHVRIEWEDPDQPNGPILGWVITMAWEDSKSKHKTDEIYFPEDRNRSHFVELPILCASSNDLHDKEPTYNFTIRAQTRMLDGLQSKVFTTEPCYLRVIPKWLEIVIGISAVLVFFLIVVVLWHGIKRVKKKVKEIQNIKVQLPKGLDSPNVTSLSNYGAYKAQFYPTGDANGNLRLPLCSRTPQTRSDFRSGDSHDPRFSTSSIDELLYVMKGSHPPPQMVNTRLLSEDSSGCSSGHESVSSSVTGRTHLSVDSGTDVDPPLSPCHDSVFLPLWKTQPPKTSPKLLPLNYSKLAEKNITAIENVNYFGIKDDHPKEYYNSSSNGSGPDNDYLQPIVVSPQEVTVAHVKVSLDPSADLKCSLEKLPPAIPPKPKKPILGSESDIIPLTEKPRIQASTKDNEAGYAKIGLSQTALQNECNIRADGFMKPQMNSASSASLPYLPSGKLVFVPTPLVLRTLQLLPSEVSALNRCTKGIQPGEKDASAGQAIGKMTPGITTPSPGITSGTRKSPYVTLDDMKNASSHRLVSNPDPQFSDNSTANKTAVDLDQEVKYSDLNLSESRSSILPPESNRTTPPPDLWKREILGNSEACPKTYV